MSSSIVRAALFLFSILVSSGAVAEQSDARQARAEVALSNDTLQLRYPGSGRSTGVEGSRISGTFFPLGPQAYAALVKELMAFGGMRWFEFDLAEGGGERTLQEDLFVGVGYQF